MSYGKLIVIEGIDGAGKKTQLDKLIALFESKKLKYVLYDFPRYYDSYWGKMVGRYLNGEFGTDVNPYLRSMFFLLDQAEAAGPIHFSLKNGTHVICNRYTTSNMIFQTAGFKTREEKDAYLDWIDEAAFRQLHIVRPDLVLGLHVDPVIARELNMQKTSREYLNGKKEDINEANFALQVEASKELQHLCSNRKEWVLIKCLKNRQLRPIDDIAAEVEKAVLKVI